jgi:chemotaxis protein methyltransferase CheR
MKITKSINTSIDMTYLLPKKMLGSGMSTTDFNRLSTFIYTYYGIKLPLSKKLMLEGRLQKRLKVLNLPSYKAYCDYVLSKEGQQLELTPMMDLVTTNKTDFFRESVHFDFLTEQVLPTAYRQLPSGNVFKVWSAGCSTGEEAYTLAMTMSEFKNKNKDFDYHITGTDISTRALDSAVTAIYPQEKVAPVPLALKRKYLLKSKDIQSKTVRIVPELRSKVSFDWLNFIEADYNKKLCTKLKSNGFLFLGHSESVAHMDLPLTQLRPTIFKKI